MPLTTTLILLTMKGQESRIQVNQSPKVEKVKTMLPSIAINTIMMKGEPKEKVKKEGKQIHQPTCETTEVETNHLPNRISIDVAKVYEVLGKNYKAKI